VNPGHEARTVRRYTGGAPTEQRDQLVVEAPLEIRLGGTPLAVLMCTPGDEIDLVRGFALTEGIVLGPAELAGVEPVGAPGEGRWSIELAGGVRVDPEQFRRNLYATSSCGVCGKASIDAVRVAAAPMAGGPVIDPASFSAMFETMRAAQTTFDVTGGIHAAAAFTADGEILALREDIGRHNAVDKLVGAVSRHRWPLGEIVMTVSGRVSFEIVQKAAVAGIPIVGGVSAASSLAVDLAAELGQTVVGFLRPDGFNVYTNPQRLQPPRHPT
jgi:FdhD protein